MVDLHSENHRYTPTSFTNFLLNST
ncbi:MAG: hypothetical protein RL662_784, partial [Bacteroidota bacterium]